MIGPPKGTLVRITGQNNAGQPIDFTGRVAGYEYRVEPPIIFVQTSDGHLREGRYGVTVVILDEEAARA